MAIGQKVNLPGWKKSKGATGFVDLSEGEYDFNITEAVVRPRKNNAPGVNVWVKLEVLAGPPQKDGRAAKGMKANTFFDIKGADDPALGDTDPKDQFALHDLKALALAAGLEFQGDTVDFNAFAGQKVHAKVVHTPNKNDSSKFFVNYRDWAPLEE